MATTTKAAEPTHKTQQEILSEPFEHYPPTGEEVIERLNKALGFFAWGFEILDAKVDAECDEVYVRAALTFHQRTGDVGSPVFATRHEGFGRARITRREDNRPWSKAQNMELARMVALVNIALDLGVGLGQQIPLVRERIINAQEQRQERQNGRGAAASGSAASSSAPSRAPSTTNPDDDVRDLLSPCAVCGEALTETEFKSGDVWSPTQLAKYAFKKFGRSLCITHYKEANETQRSNGVQRWDKPAGDALDDELPF